MKNKKIIGLGILAASGILALAGCSEAHTHASEEWKHDSENHWKVCSADEAIFGMEAHSFSKSEVAATDEADGYTLWTCSCGYTYKDAYTQKTYGITFEGNDLAYAIGLPTEAKLGAKVEFKVTVESGYEAYEVTASYVKDGKDVVLALDGTIQDGYEFTMPAAAVTIKAEARGAYFIAEPEDAEKIVVDRENQYATDVKLNQFIGGFISNGRKSTGTTLYARAGAEVYILANYISSADNIKYLANGTQLEADEVTVVTQEAKEATDDTPAVEEKTETYSVYKFVMPAANVVLDITAEEKAYEVEVDAPDWAITKLYTVDEEGEQQEVTKVKGGTLVYLEISLDADHQDGNYKISDVSAAYETFSGYVIKQNGEEKKGSSQTSTTTQVTAGAKYSYTVSTYTAYREKVTLKIKTLEAAFKDESFVGSFAGTEWYSTFTKGYSSYTATATAFGEFDIKGSWSTYKYYALEKESTKAYNRVSIATTSGGSACGAHIYYEDKVLLVNYYSTRGDNFSDFFFLVKGLSSSSDITWSYEGNNLYDDTDSVGYVVAKDADGNEYGNVLKIYRDIYINVTYTLDEGSTDIATGSFKIMKNGEEIAHHTHVEAAE